MKKRVLSLFLAITLCLTLTPTGALAAEGQPPKQMVTATQEAETGAGENASPAKPEENPTEDAPAAQPPNRPKKLVCVTPSTRKRAIRANSTPIATWMVP